jgi:hypothetical protein
MRSQNFIFDKLSNTSGMRFVQKAPTALGHYHFYFCENKLGGGCQSDDFSRHMATIRGVGPTPTVLTTSITVMANSEFNLTWRSPLPSSAERILGWRLSGILQRADVSSSASGSFLAVGRGGHGHFFGSFGDNDEDDTTDGACS